MRALRHEKGIGETRARFADCPHCKYYWTNEELIESYLVHGVKVPGLTAYPDQAKRLKAMAIEYQKSPPNSTQMEAYIVDAGYNHHIHAPSSCFGKTKSESISAKSKKSGHKRNLECRYRYPRRKKQKTVIQDTGDVVNWYLWNGTFNERKIKEVCLKRHAYDAFQNVSCPAISQSKMTGNTNVSKLMPGPAGQYNFKYSLKSTQKDDTEEYERVCQAIEKVLSKLKKDATDCSVSISRILAASFAHQKTNVLGAALASYLTRTKSRFLFSHETVWCPIRDIYKLLTGETVGAIIDNHGKTPFFICSALNYLCRPVELENLGAKHFFSHYEVVKQSSRNEDELMQFTNNPFQHPSFRPSKGTFLQGVRERDYSKLIQVFQSDFPDTAEFGGCILDPATIITEPMETYAQLVLLLFCPYRTLDDITIDGSYVKKLRHAFGVGLIDAAAQKFLQNIQDAKSNCFRSKARDDDLQRHTECYMPADEEFDNDCGEDDDDNFSECNIDANELDELLKLLDEEFTENQNTHNETQPNTMPHIHDLSSIRQKATHAGGYEHIAAMSADNNPDDKAIEMAVHSNSTNSENGGADNENNPEQQLPTKSDLVAILLSKTQRRERSFPGIDNTETVDVREANGSVSSIIDWAKAAKLDRKQRRAFEIFVGTFVLSFYWDADGNPEQRQDQHNFAKEKH